MTELEETSPGTDPAAADYRQRIRARYRERAAERTAAEQQLTELVTQTAAADGPALLDDPRTDTGTGHPAETGHGTSAVASSTLNFGTPALHTLVCLTTHHHPAATPHC